MSNEPKVHLLLKTYRSLIDISNPNEKASGKLRGSAVVSIGRREIEAYSRYQDFAIIRKTIDYESDERESGFVRFLAEEPLEIATRYWPLMRRGDLGLTIDGNPDRLTEFFGEIDAQAKKTTKLRTRALAVGGTCWAGEFAGVNGEEPEAFVTDYVSIAGLLREMRSGFSLAGYVAFEPPMAAARMGM